MSNLLFMDESNGNGVYAVKPNNTVNMGATSTNKPNNIDNIMAVATNPIATLSTSASNEDLSQSLSEYTDADESISAPTEFLAEFLSAVMLKNYKKALKYCKLILQYEPHNATAKDFYPLILEKLHGTASSDSDENYNKSSSPEIANSVYPSAGESDEAASDNHQQQQQAQQKQKQKQKQKHDNNATDDSDDFIPNDDIFSGEARCSNSSGDDDNGGGGGGGDGGGGGGGRGSGGGGSRGVESSSSVSMDEDVDEDLDDDEDDAVEDDFAEDAMSSSGDDLPNDDGNICLDNAFSGLDNASHSSRNSSSGAESGRSRSDNTSHSYSSLLLEEDDDILPTNAHFSNYKETQDLDVSNGNKMPSASCSDSESPTEPLTQRLAAILLSKCGVSSKDENF